MNCTVTIGIPVYNSQDYILRTMMSVLAQTYSDIDVLIVDDASSDKTMDIIRDLQATHVCGNKIRVLNQPSNLGVGAARNRIIDEAFGNYLYFLDSDDLIHGDETISLMVSHAQRIDADLVIGSYEKVWTEMVEKKEFYRYDRLDFVDDDAFAKYAYRKYAGVQASSCNYLLKLSLIRSLNLSFSNADFLEDFIFTHELVTCVKKVVTLPDLTYIYQFHGNSLSHCLPRDRIPKQEIVKTIKGVERLKELSKHLLFKPYLSSQMCCMLRTDFYIICSILKNERVIVPSFSMEEIKEILRCPLSIKQLLSDGSCRWWNLFFVAIGHMPAPMCVFVIKIVGKIKGII